MREINGQTDIFGNTFREVQMSEPAPAKKVSKPNPVVVYYKFICETAYNVYTIYAQHEAQAYAKCRRMYGQCPVRIRQEY